MTDQQRAAMQMAYDLLCRPVDTIAEMYCFGMGDCDEVRAELREALAQPLGEWVDLTDYEILECAPINGATVESVAIAVAAKLKEKNTPKVVPQGEPVAWGHPNTAITGKKQALMMVNLEIPSNAQYPELWVPLYTAPPSVEAAAMNQSFRNASPYHGFLGQPQTPEQLQKIINAAIEATKEKMKKVFAVATPKSTWTTDRIIAEIEDMK